MDSRREFIKKSILLSGATGLSSILPSSIQRALAINPAPGSAYLDAEHVVILMQENRSFDHCFGTLQGVRGFNDPRAFKLANGNPVWLQTNQEGLTYAPFRLNINKTKATWMGSLPHSRASQVDAFNQGQHDNWLIACKMKNKKYAHIPFTLGYYNREDLPFNYAMADAFTVCDQNFSSAMTSTWPNRHYLWSGTIREEENAQSRAHIRNDLAFGEAKWKTFPERLEENNISWKVYQNELTCGGGFEREERSWLANYTCNPLEYFARYNVKFSDRYVKSLHQQTETLPKEIEVLNEQLKSVSTTDKRFQKLQADILKKKDVLDKALDELKLWIPERYEKLSQAEKNLYEKAFSVNKDDPDYHNLAPLEYHEAGELRTLNIPKGDIFYNFRKDVDTGKLPTVSWLVAPEKFSEHPSAPLYGSWYISEVLDILTKNPEVWKKTIFILTYDENDGYFDHIPPFMPPSPIKSNAGKVSRGIDTSIEYIPLEQELNYGVHKDAARAGQIGLGYRVPMIIASPWSRGGRVNSQVFDHTSTLQFLEGFLTEKFGLKIKEENISEWRRTVCGDLTSIFSKYDPEGKESSFILNRKAHIEKIYNAKYAADLTSFNALSESEIGNIKKDLFSSDLLPKQEKGIRPSCALPYQLYADGNLNKERTGFEVKFEARKDVFAGKSAGAPFTVYTPANFKSEQGDTFEIMRNWQYAVKAGDQLNDTWLVNSFEKKAYHLRIYGPNGFYREFMGDVKDPKIFVKCEYESEPGTKDRLTGNLQFFIQNFDLSQNYEITIKDVYQKGTARQILVKPGKEERFSLNLEKSFGWYEVNICVKGFERFMKQYAGRVETGKESMTDPLMGQIV